MFTLGFSYIGLIFLLMLYVPNIIWAKNQPMGYDSYSAGESRVLLAFERVGQVLCSCCALMFSDFNVRKTPWLAVLALAAALMMLYEISWVRYFKSERSMADFYRGICGIPLALAVLPVAAFILLGIYGSNLLMILSSVILGIGHIGIHAAHRREVCGKPARKGFFRRLLRTFAAAFAALVLVVCSVIIGGRNINYIRHYVNLAGGGVDEELYIPLNGQEQYVLVRGESTENPVIIYLHGGPSSPDTYTSYAFSDSLTDRYTVIGWDQRGCGRTYFRNIKSDPENTTVDFEQALADLDMLVDYAREKFNKEKVIIMGHSYGTILGGKYTQLCPEKVSEYIAVGQVVSLERSDVYSYEDALAKAAAVGDDTSVLRAAYEQYKESGELKDLLALRALVSKYHPAEKADKTTFYAVFSPYFGFEDVRWFLRQLGDMDDYFALNKQLFDYTFAADMSGDTEYEVPVHFISGSCDWVCPVDSVKGYADSITAPSVKCDVMEGCGHLPQYDEPEEFASLIK